MNAHVRQTHGIKILKKKHQIIRNLHKNNQSPTQYGDQVWHSNFLIFEYLQENPLEKHQNVMEVGCGWGLLGIFCAKHFKSNSLLVDKDECVFPYAEEHQTLNDVSAKTKHSSFGELSEGVLEKQDVIVGSDICYWPELASNLKKLISDAVAARVKKIIIADPGRDIFLKLAKFCQTQFGGTLLEWPYRGRKKKFGYILIIQTG
ncbi:Ribosomal protein L11 methyltransferase [Thalassocella blandensis]|nr:Ribosomal protein L11 methyltransferase [Thalassocella blandensis]